MKHFYRLFFVFLFLSACAQSPGDRGVFMNADYSSNGSYVNAELSSQFSMINEHY